MLVGNGLIAKAFTNSINNNDKTIFFASGVSNSREVRLEEFLREREMLIKAVYEDKFLVYFSTCSIYDPELLDSPYVVHKVMMENIVKTCKNYAIFRLPQVVGKTFNPNTLTNYLCARITSGDFFQVWGNAKRNLIDIEDIALIVNYLLQNKLANGVTFNIASPISVYISELVNFFEIILKKKANYEILNLGGSYSIDTCLLNDYAKEAGVIFDHQYVEKIIRKYYAN